MPKVSVIVPVYNTEKYLKRCIDSLVGQTYNDIEIILVDDKSTDNSLSIISAYQEKYPEKIKVLQTKTNSGPSTARNLGIDIATGEYIGFVDSDDYIVPDYYESLVSACEETSADIARTDRKIVCCNIDLLFLRRNCQYDEFTVINPREDSRYLVTEPPGVTNKVIKRKLIGNSKFPEGLKWEDYPFAMPLMVNANSIANVPGKNYVYNMHLNSTTCKDARRLNGKLLDIFTCSDMVGQTCLTPDTNANVSYQINYVQMHNCLQRLKEITNARMPISEKRELLTLLSNLIKTKYGNWQEHEIYQEQKSTRFIHGIRMAAVEGLLLPEDTLPKEEEQLKQLIKVKLDQNIKK